MKIAIAAAAAALSVALTACGGGSGNNNSAQHSPTAKQGNGGAKVKQFNPLHVAHNWLSGGSDQINMGAVGGSGETGNASITQKKGGSQVVIHVNEPKGAKQPAHIHQGSCKKPNQTPWKVLHDVVNGTSSTFVPGLSVSKVKSGPYAIIVHQSATNMQKYVACGNLQL